MPRFSIVLPTTDRPSLLAAGVRAVLETKFDDLELIVSDNFSQQHAAEILAGLGDKRLRVIRTDRRLAAADHWEFAWEHVRGEFVMYLGDDNALHPEILSFADNAIRDHDLDVLSWRNCTYFHPDWNITYSLWPNRGNILGIDAGTTRRLYSCNPSAVLEAYCRELRLPGCFPCMLNFLFRKADAENIRRRVGRFFWSPNPDMTMSYLILGTIRPDRFAYYDAIGAIGGRSRHSNLATLLSRGKATRRAYDYIEEHRGQDIFPHHNPKFIAMSNSLAATISQAKAQMPEDFGRHRYDAKTLARRTIDDLYVDRTVPWDDDPTFLAEVDDFINSLPAPDAAEIFAYRDQSVARLRQEESKVASNFTRNPGGVRASISHYRRKANAEGLVLAWRLFRQTGRNPFGYYWAAGGTTYVDMELYSGHDIADVARDLPRILASFDRRSDEFASHSRHAGMLGEILPAVPASAASAAVAKQATAVQ